MDWMDGWMEGGREDGMAARGRYKQQIEFRSASARCVCGRVVTRHKKQCGNVPRWA
jgi:hypothetical protein